MPTVPVAPERSIGSDVRRWSAMVIDSSQLGDDHPQPVLPDPSFDRYARMVQAVLHVPVALVTIVESDRQVFPGAVGLTPERDAERQTPLSYSFCKHVVQAQAPLIVGDARDDARVSDNPAIEELGVLAYAGYPITDNSGVVIGSLCALDSEPREWTVAELAALDDLAAACSTEIALRELRRMAIAAARDAYEVGNRARVLLNLTQRLARTRTLADISRALLRVAVEDLECAQAGIWVVDHDDVNALRYVRDPAISWPRAERISRVPIDDSNPFGTALLSASAQFFSSRRAEDRIFPPTTAEVVPDDGSARVYLPLIVDGERFGCLALLWTDHRDFGADDRITMDAVAASTGIAIQRVWLLADRATITTKLQNALLSNLPQPAGMELAARYRPADQADRMGGDWYDVVELPSGAIGLTIGDVVGHGVDAAAAMGPLRSMLRAFGWDGDDAPAQAVTRLDAAIQELRPGVLATVLYAQIEPGEVDGGRLLRWTNAGHPPAILLWPGGSCETLTGDGIDRLLGVGESARHDHSIVVPEGAILAMFSDGLIQNRHEDMDLGRARLATALEANPDRSADEIAGAVLAAMVGDQPPDDVALLVVRFGTPT
jgi:serine phosphatase RsbU (regulator of sigma subunit)